MFRFLFYLLILGATLRAQDPPLPLESVTLEGTSLTKEFVLDLAGLRIGAPINKSGIEAACARLQESGIFQSINYRYGPGSNHGYALTLSVADQGILMAAAIDLPGVDENEIWEWLASQYPAFRRKVPANDAAQQFIATKIEQHLGPKLAGRHLVARLESDLVRRTTLISFQPEKLPRVGAMNFTGQSELSAAQLSALIQKVVEDGYTERRFRQALELNARRAYEEHGMYRVRFNSVTMQELSDGSVAVTTALEEGPKYTLGDVQFIGDHLPLSMMSDAAKFKKGQVANWTEIQSGIWASERPLKRTGYFDASSSSERVFHDDSHVLDVRISFHLGSFYHFGEVRFTGLSPALEAEAYKVWKLKPGDPYDYDYPRDFMPAFLQAVGGQHFKSYKVLTQKNNATHQADFTIAFEPR
jgi:outer membrane protein insertion porin family